MSNEILEGFEILEEGNSKVDAVSKAMIYNKEVREKTNKYAIVLSKMFEFLKMKENGRSFLPNMYTNLFLKKYEVVTVENSFYMYDAGVYKEKTSEEMKSIIYHDLQERFNEVIPDLEPTWIEKTLTLIKNSTQIGYNRFSKEFNSRNIGNFINVKNGLIKFNFDDGTYKFLEHNKNLKSTIQLNVEYNPKQKNMMHFEEFLKTSLNTDKERFFLQEVMGYMMIHYLADGDGQSFFVMDGEGGNGKGTFQRILVEILDSNNVCFEKSKTLFDDSNQNQFYGFGMIHKLCIAIGETKRELKNLELPKMISGHDGIEIEVKGLMEKLKYVFEGKILMSTNQETSIRDTSIGVKRRIKFISMNNKIEKKIKGLDDKLKSEKQAIFIWALEGLSRLIRNEWSFTLPESHYDCFNKHFKHSDNFQAFIENHIIESHDGMMLRTDVYELMNEQFGKIYKKKDDLYKKFEKAIKEHLDGLELTIKSGRCKSFVDNTSRNSSCYVGIQYVENKDTEPERVKFNDAEYILKSIDKLNEHELLNIIQKAQDKIRSEKKKDSWMSEAIKKEKELNNEQVVL